MPDTEKKQIRDVAQLLKDKDELMAIEPATAQERKEVGQLLEILVEELDDVITDLEKSNSGMIIVKDLIEQTRQVAHKATELNPPRMIGPEEEPFGGWEKST